MSKMFAVFLKQNACVYRHSFAFFYCWYK